MCDPYFNQLLGPAVNAVLETMFFSGPLGLSSPNDGMPRLEAQISFSGEISGIIRVSITEESARSLAASFLGELEQSLSRSQIAEVVCELTNMLCGWIVSKSRHQGWFDLGSPEMIAPPSKQSLGTPLCQQSFAVENGTLTVSLYPIGSA